MTNTSFRHERNLASNRLNRSVKGLHEFRPDIGKFNPREAPFLIKSTKHLRNIFANIFFNKGIHVRKGLVSTSRKKRHYATCRNYANALHFPSFRFHVLFLLVPMLAVTLQGVSLRVASQQP